MTSTLTSTLTKGFKSIQLPNFNTNLLSVIAFIVFGAMLFLIASSIVSADGCLSKFSDLMDATETLEDAQADYDAAVAEWEAAPLWKKAYYWAAVLYYRTKLEIASRNFSSALEAYLECIGNLSDSGGCDSGGCDSNA